MKKFFVLVLLTIFAVLTVTSISPAKKISLYVAHIFMSEPTRGIVERAISKFEERYPNVDVKPITMHNDYYQTVGLLSLFATGQPPDVYFNFGGDKQIGPYVEAGYALDLTEILSSEKNWEGDKIWKDSFLPGALVAGRMEIEREKLYELPGWELNLAAIWYNVDVFQKVGVSPPETYAEWGTVCQKIKNAGIIPIILGNKGQWQGGHWFAITIQRSAGKKAYEDLMSKRKSFTDPDIVKAFSLIGDMAQRGFIVEGVNTVERDEVLPLLYTGKAGMEAIAGTWHVGGALEYEGYNFGFFKTPKVVDGKGDWRVELSNKAGWLIYEGTKHREEAIAFLRAQTSFESGKERAEVGIISPIAGTNEFLHPLAKRAVREIAAPAPATIIYPEDGYELEYVQFFQDALAAVLGGQPVEEALAKVQKQAREYQNLR